MDTKGDEMRETKFRAWDKTYINNVSTREDAVQEFIRLYGKPVKHDF